MEEIERQDEDTAPSVTQGPTASDEDPSLTSKERIKSFLVNHWRGLFCFIIPLIFIPVNTRGPVEKYQWCAYTLVLMAAFWVTECIPLAVTSVLPIIIFPLTGVMNTTTTCNCYMNVRLVLDDLITEPQDTIMMFLGSLILASAVDQSGLHKRLALCAIRAIGYSHYKLLFAISFVTMFISMWITNTAATTMMVPITFALLQVFEDENLLKIYETNANGDNIASDITTCYFCASTFSATIGGIGTLVGTVTNLVFIGLFNKMYPDAPEYLSFPNFSAYAIPLMLILEVLMYVSMVIVYLGFLRPNSAAAKRSRISPEGIEAAKMTVDRQWKELGRITFWEIMVIFLFTFAILLFFSRSPQIFVGWGDKIVDIFGLRDSKFVLDSSAAMMIAFLMLLLPSNLKFFDHMKSKDTTNPPKEPISPVLNWNIMNTTTPYSFMFLLGGGFALSEAAKKNYTDLNGKIGLALKLLIRNLPNSVVIFILITFTVFITNFASNVAVCNVVAPIAMQLAKEVDVNPLWYDIAVGFSASFCFILPVGTPGNLVVQGAANIPTLKMMKAGIGPTITTIFVTWISVCFWAPVVWPDLNTLPTWINSEISHSIDQILFIPSGRTLAESDWGGTTALPDILLPSSSMQALLCSCLKDNDASEITKQRETF